MDLGSGRTFGHTGRYERKWILFPGAAPSAPEETRNSRDEKTPRAESTGRKRPRHRTWRGRKNSAVRFRQSAVQAAVYLTYPCPIRTGITVTDSRGLSPHSTCYINVTAAGLINIDFNQTLSHWESFVKGHFGIAYPITPLAPSVSERCRYKRSVPYTENILPNGH